MDNEELEGVKFSEFPSATPDNADDVVGLHAGDNARFSVANFVLAVRQGLANLYVPQTRTINGKALDDDITLSASDIGAVDADDVGVADGVASLDSNGKVPSSQLPPISSDAADITYDPTTSGVSATNVQDALDEAFDDLDGKQDSITASGILKGNGAGGVTAATAGTDYADPSAGVYYGVCDSTNSSQAKEVTISGITALYEGLHVQIRFTQSQTYNGMPTLNVNSLGAKDIYSSGSIPAERGEWRTNSVLDMVYDGTRWRIVNGQHAEGSIWGITRLSTSTSSTSTTEAATPSAVKSAYDLANGKYTKPSGGIPASDLASGVIPTVPSASTANPQMDGTASPGSTGEWADGGHIHPRYTGAYAYDTIFSTVTDIHTDTTVTLDKNYGDYKLLVISFNSRVADTQSYRMILTLSPLSIDLWGSYAIASREANGFVRIVPVSNQPKQIRFALTDLTALYVTEIRGIY